MKKPLKVLILEDERLTARSLSLDITDLGAEVVSPVVKNEDLVDMALKQKPDLILMDVRLTGELNGIELAERIHKIKKIPIVFMSGYATEYIKERAQKFSPIAFLEKPVSLEVIKKILDNLTK